MGDIIFRIPTSAYYKHVIGTTYSSRNQYIDYAYLIYTGTFGTCKYHGLMLG